jgi:hypothetical protein
MYIILNTVLFDNDRNPMYAVNRIRFARPRGWVVRLRFIPYSLSRARAKSTPHGLGLMVRAASPSTPRLFDAAIYSI